jgi:hypothetical protein
MNNELFLKMYRNVTKTESNDHLESTKLAWHIKTYCLKASVDSPGERIKIFLGCTNKHHGYSQSNAAVGKVKCKCEAVDISHSGGWRGLFYICMWLSNSNVCDGLL